MQTDSLVSENPKLNWFRRWPALIIFIISISVLSFGTYFVISPSSLTAAVSSSGTTRCIDNKGNSANLTWSYKGTLDWMTGNKIFLRITYWDALNQTEIQMNRSSASPILVKNITDGTINSVPNLTQAQAIQLIDFTGNKLMISPFVCTNLIVD